MIFAFWRIFGAVTLTLLLTKSPTAGHQGLIENGWSRPSIGIHIDSLPDMYIMPLNSEFRREMESSFLLNPRSDLEPIHAITWSMRSKLGFTDADIIVCTLYSNGSDVVAPFEEESQMAGVVVDDETWDTGDNSFSKYADLQAGLCVDSAAIQ